jgi:ABC-2 type transport system ATP-binding protein
VTGDVAVEVRGLTKQFRNGIVAVEGLDLAVRRGEIFGLLGPNGAGKTTTLRILLGLMSPTSGQAFVFGLHPGDPRVLRRVGAMGETAFYPFLSGRDNLRVAARRCRLPDERVDAVVELVGLAERARDRVAGYSLGMHQRLGVALALLKDPELLILDEPSNGLDAIGQLEMQELIRRLGAEGRTIVLSSHDMREVEELCGRVAVISGGRLLFEGTPEELRGRMHVWVRADPLDTAAVVAAGLPDVEAAEGSGELLSLVLHDVAETRVAAVNRGLVQAGVQVSELRSERRPLRDVFLELTGGRTGGANSARAPRRTRLRRLLRRPSGE